jgi:hypothetical protein
LTTIRSAPHGASWTNRCHSVTSRSNSPDPSNKLFGETVIFGSVDVVL